MNFVHEIRMKFVIFGKLGKSSYEFVRIREGYVTSVVMWPVYCIVIDELRVAGVMNNKL